MKKNDFILVCVFLVIGAVLLLSNYLGRDSEAKYVVVTVEEKQYKVLDLNKDTILKIVNSKDDYNILQIKDGKANMMESNCKNQICVKSKEISEAGETIVCLPHEVVVKIVSRKN